MPFWTSQDLEELAPELIAPYTASSVDCNSYTLHMGDEFFCTADQIQSAGVSPAIQKLAEGQGFTIPPGQFAFLLTREKIRVPKNAMAFISIKSGMKFHGLVNVSGFHVDPGYEGRLVFSVHNAGPSPLSLKQGMPLFVIWYASLREESKKTYNTDKGYSGIDPKHIQGMSKEILSMQNVTENIKQMQDTFVKHKPILDHLNFFYRAIVIAVFAALMIGVAGFSWDFGRSIWLRITEPAVKTIAPAAEKSSEQEPQARRNEAERQDN